MASLYFQANTPVTAEKRDTTVVFSRGFNNRITLNGIHLNDSVNKLISTPFEGEIIQLGKQNRVDITIDNKAIAEENRNTNQNSNCDNQVAKKRQKAPPRNHIKISQTGKNNRVKINSH